MTKDEKTTRATNILKFFDTHRVEKAGGYWTDLNDTEKFKKEWLLERMDAKKEWIYWHDAPPKYTCVVISDKPTSALLTSKLEDLYFSMLLDDHKIEKCFVYCNDNQKCCDVSSVLQARQKFESMRKYIDHNYSPESKQEYSRKDAMQDIRKLEYRMQNLVESTMRDIIRKHLRG